MSAHAHIRTLPCAEIGLDRLSINAEIHAHGEAGKWWVEYGSTSKLGLKTSKQNLPPALGAVYVEDWQDNTGAWGYWGKAHTHHKDADGRGYLRIHEPGLNHDYNHEGADIIHLASFLYTGPIVNPVDSEFHFPSPHLAGNQLDLRDAKVSLEFRGQNFKANGCEFCFWIQHQPNIEVGNTQEALRTNWAFSARTLTDELQDGQWHKVEYELSNDSNRWTFGGYDSFHKKAWTRTRYHYSAPIDRVLAHANCNIFHLLAFIDEDLPPEGNIDLARLKITYRQNSLLSPLHGTTLLSSPSEGEGDPQVLCDGHRHGAGHSWASTSFPASKPEFVYRLAKTATVQKIQLHQNADFPTREVEILTSIDGENFQPLNSATLPKKGEPNANFAFTLIEELSQEAQYLKFILKKGYSEERWGLAGIEVFGKGIELKSDNDYNRVNLDLEELAPGQMIHFRVHVETNSGSTQTETHSHQMPSDARPLIKLNEVRRVQAHSVRVSARLNPMGKACRYHFAFRKNDGEILKTPERPAGEQIAARAVFADLNHLDADTRYHYRLIAENEYGRVESNEKSFTTQKDDP